MDAGIQRGGGPVKIKTENSIRILEHATYYIRWDRFDGTPKTTRTLPLSKEELEALAILYSLISELRQAVGQ